MDLKLFRERVYDDWINKPFDFVGTDGLYYSGLLEDWLEDGSLVLDRVNVFDRTGEDLIHSIQEADLSIIVSPAFVSYIFTFDHTVSDKMTGKALEDRNKRWDKENERTEKKRRELTDIRERRERKDRERRERTEQETETYNGEGTPHPV
jgi:hypothetical protein